MLGLSYPQMLSIFPCCIFNLSLIYALNDDAIHSFIEGQPCFKHLREAGNVTYMQLDILS